MGYSPAILLLFVSSAFAVTIPGGTVKAQILPKNSGLCLDITGSSSTPGTRLQQWACTGADNQSWYMLPQSDGSYGIKSALDQLVMTVFSGWLANGTRVVQEPWTASKLQQHWKAQSSAEYPGYYNLVAESSGSCADVTGGSGAINSGAPIEQWACWYGANQTWTIQAMNQIHLSWTASMSGDVTGYYVYRSLVNGGPYTRINAHPLTATTLTFTDASLKPGTSFYYVATATNGKAESSYSNQAMATVPN